MSLDYRLRKSCRFVEGCWKMSPPERRAPGPRHCGAKRLRISHPLRASEDLHSYSVQEQDILYARAHRLSLCQVLQRLFVLLREAVRELYQVVRWTCFDTPDVDA